MPAPISNGHSPAENQDSSELIAALLEAARYGDIDDVKDLLSQGVQLSSQDSQALHMAAANGHLDVVRYLINNGGVVHEMILAGANAAALNRYDRTPLDEALSRDKMDVVNSINAATASLQLNVTHLN